jgi:hypothetical protein
VTLARARWAEEQGIGVLRDPAGRGELEHEGTVHLLVEVEIEGVEPLADIAEAGLLHAALEESVLPLDQLALKNAKGSGVLFPKPLFL